MVVEVQAVLAGGAVVCHCSWASIGFATRAIVVARLSRMLNPGFGSWRDVRASAAARSMDRKAREIFGTKFFG